MTATTLLSPLLVAALPAGVWAGAAVGTLGAVALIWVGLRSSRRRRAGDRRREEPLPPVGERAPRPQPLTDRAASCCPRCHRSYPAGHRYCPFDAEELAAPSPWSVEHTHSADDEAGKICPTCAARYGHAATVCGRDGSELVSVN